MPYKMIEGCLNSPFDSVKLSIGQGTLTEDRSQKTDVRLGSRKAMRPEISEAFNPPSLPASWHPSFKHITYEL